MRVFHTQKIEHKKQKQIILFSNTIHKLSSEELLKKNHFKVRVFKKN